MYLSDGFQKPYPFRADVIVALDDVIDQKIDALHELESQFYEGGANGSEEHVRSVPPARDAAARKSWLRQNRWGAINSSVADRFRDDLVRLYGPEKGKSVKFAEAFELCEYGRRPSPEELVKMFPIPDVKGSTK
jgi:hypothetical protein